MVAVLLAAAVIGLRARGSFPDQASSSLADAGGTVIASIFAVAEGAGLVACVLVLALVLRVLARAAGAGLVRSGSTRC
jgi:hypothetical protein